MRVGPIRSAGMSDWHVTCSSLSTHPEGIGPTLAPEQVAKAWKPVAGNLSAEKSADGSWLKVGLSSDSFLDT